MGLVDNIHVSILQMGKLRFGELKISGAALRKHVEQRSTIEERPGCEVMFWC